MQPPGVKLQEPFTTLKIARPGIGAEQDQESFPEHSTSTAIDVWMTCIMTGKRMSVLKVLAHTPECQPFRNLPQNLITLLPSTVKLTELETSQVPIPVMRTSHVLAPKFVHNLIIVYRGGILIQNQECVTVVIALTTDEAINIKISQYHVKLKIEN